MKPRNKGLYELLIKTRARGETIAHFCKRTGAPFGTAQRWSRSDDLLARVASIHAEWDGNFRSRNARQIAAAQKTIYALSQGGSELVKLRASERIIDDRRAATAADIQRQLAELMERVRELDGGNAAQ
jgi:hypothetical protein